MDYQVQAGRDARALNWQRQEKASQNPSHPATDRTRRKIRLEFETCPTIPTHPGRLSGRHREQARSHKGSRVYSGSVAGTDPTVGACSRRQWVNDPYGDWHGLFASKLAPTVELGYGRKDRSAARPPRLCFALLCFALAFDLGRPIKHEGRTQALRSGQPGMDAGLAALGHG